MKKIIFLFGLCCFAMKSYAQYNIQTFDGTTQTVCNGTFFDNGGVGGSSTNNAAGNYSNNLDQSITFCPGTAGDVIKVTFTYFDIKETNGSNKACEDFLYVYQGNTITPSPDDIYCGSLTGALLPVILSTSPDGCVTFEFVSSNSGNRGGWVANISCVTPCQDPTANLMDLSTIDICPTQSLNPGSMTISVDASNSTVGAYTLPTIQNIVFYDWEWGDGTSTTTNTPNTTHTYATDGIYVLKLRVRDDNTDFSSSGCISNNSLTRLVRVLPPPDFTGSTTSPQNVACGGSTTISSVTNSQTSTQDLPLISTGTVALPDGNGQSYVSGANYSGLFPAGATLSAGCYPTVTFTMEHSWSRDLTIDLIAPNGASVRLFNRSGIPGNLQPSYKFGTCVNGLDDGAVGCGATYTVVNSGGNSWTNYGAAISTTTTAACAGYGGTCEAGNYYRPLTYNSATPFSTIDGAPLNGTWTIKITDNQSLDDGSLFGWTLSFPNACYTPLETVTPDITSAVWSTADAGPAVPVQTPGSVALVDPGPDACPTPGTCLGNTLTNSINLGTFNANGSFDYDVLITDEFGCQYQNTVTLNVICSLFATSSGATTLCPGGSTTITITGTPNATVTYNINGGADQTVVLDASGVASINTGALAANATYNLTEVTDGVVTIALSESELVAIAALPTVTALNGGATYCAGDAIADVTATVTGTGPWTIDYTLDGVAQSANGASSPISLGNAPGVYIVTNVSDASCSNAANGTETITVNPLPTVTAVNGGNTYCAGDAVAAILVSVTGTGPWTIDYTLDGVAQSANGAASPISLGNAPGVYAVTTVTDANCSNSATGNQTITINPLPTVTAVNGGNTYCTGDVIANITVDVTGTSPWTIDYTLDGAAQSVNGASSPISLGNAPGTYIVTNISDANCSNAAAGTETITVNPLPTVTAVTGGASYCAGDAIANILVSTTGTGPWTIDYTLNGVAQSANGAASPISLGNAAGVYVLSNVTDANCANTASGTQTITVNPLPTVTAVNGGNTYCAGAVIANITVDVTGSSPWTIDYTLDGVAQSANGLTSPISLGNAPGVYIVTNVSDASCSNAAAGTETITVNPLPTFSLTATDPTVCNAADGQILVSGLNANTNYDITYNDDGVTTGPMTILSDASGNILISGLNAGTYDNFIVSLAGCSATDALGVSLNNPGAPNVNDLANQVLCNTSFILPAITGTNLSGNEAYYDGPNGTGTQYLPGDAIASSILMFIFDINGVCSDQENFTITINPLPTVTAVNGGNTYCAGAAIANITADVTGTGPWTVDYTLNGVAQSASGAASPISLGNAPGVYVVTNVTDANCTNAANGTQTITVNPLPTVSAVNGGNSYCIGDVMANITADLTGTGPWTVDYTVDGVAQSANGAASPINLGNAAGVYVVTNVSDANCTNSASGTQTITLNPLPTVTAVNGGNTYCAGAAIANITADVTGTGPWTVDFTVDGVAQSVNGASSPISLGNAPGVYVVTNVTDATCTNAANGTQTITVNALPTLTAVNGGNAYCVGDVAANITADVTGTGPWTIDYTLDGVAQTANGAASPISLGNAAGVYVVTNVTDANCTNTASGTQTITMNPLPTVTAINGGATYCAGDVIANITVDVTGNSPWTIDYTLNGVAQTANGVTSPISLGNAPGVYVLTNVSTGACTNTANGTETITVNSVPTVSSVNGGASYCAGDAIANITVSSTGTGPWTINYTLDGVAQTASGAASPISLGNAPGVYVVTNVSDALCSNSASGTQTITVNALPTVTTLSGGNTYCVGDVPANILAAVTGTGPWSVDYTLNGVAQTANGATSPISLGNSAGVYVVTNVSDLACNNSASGTQTITINALPPAPTASNDTSYCSYQTLAAMQAQAVAGGTISWYSDANLNNLLANAATLTPGTTVGTTTYYVTQTVNGCQSLAESVNVTINVCELEIPTAFTPDNDGVNDSWEIVNLKEFFPNCVVTVYNRWGGLIFESEGYQVAWDGKYNGEEMPVASYYFIVNFNDGLTETKTGTVSIVKK